jgi:ABC-type Fe3+-siderophore transport system permease subunit
VLLLDFMAAIAAALSAALLATKSTAKAGYEIATGIGINTNTTAIIMFTACSMT